MTLLGSTSFYIMMWMIIFVGKLKYTDSINVALNARGTYCTNKALPGEFFDGITSEIVDFDHSRRDLYMLIMLKEPYNIQYVDIHRYIGPIIRNKNVSIEINLNDGPFHSMCGIFAKTLCEDIPILRVNCQSWGMLFSRIMVEFGTDDYLYLSEIEIHTLANRLPKIKHVLIHRGCFDEFDDEAELLSWEKCHEKCFKHAFIFAGIKDKKYCGCKNNINPFAELTVEECDLLCDDGVGACGSKEAFSVYIVNLPLPYYIGCFLSGGKAKYRNLFNGLATAMTCIYHCNDYNLAIVENKSHCFCLNLNENNYSSDLLVKSRNHCAEGCLDDHFCGGIGHVSVYSTCKAQLGNAITCSELLLCSAMYSYDILGRCRGTCRKGYVGEYCVERTNVSLKKLLTTTEDTRIEVRKQNWILNFLKKNTIMLIVAPTFFLGMILMQAFCSNRIRSAKSSVHLKDIQKRKMTAPELSVPPQLKPVPPQVKPAPPQVKPVPLQVKPVPPQVKPVPPQVKPLPPQVTPIPPQVTPVLPPVTPVPAQLTPVPPKVIPPVKPLPGPNK